MSTGRRNPYLNYWDILFDKKISEWLSCKPKLGLEVYPCYACRAIFGSRNSFLDHVNRRGMVLKYKCRDCKGTTFFEFYNPCSFLLHTRQHYNLVEGCINLDNLEISTLPFGLGGFLPDKNIPMLYNVKDDNEGESTFINTRFYSPVPSSMGQSIVTLAPNELLFFFSPAPNTAPISLVLKQMSANIPRCKFINLDTRRFTPIPEGLDINGKEIATTDVPIVKQECQDEQNFDFSLPVITKTETIYESNDESEAETLQSAVEHFPHCPECNEAQIISMSEHFLKNDRLFEDDLKCRMCKYIAPTKCSLKAHERIHGSKAPYVCPECGKDFQDSQLLHSHLGDVCFHLTKQVRHKCPAKKCGKIFAQLSTFAAHFMSHFNSLTACTLCEEKYFNTKDEYLNHSKKHDSEHFVGKNVYMCTVCNNSEEIFEDENYQQHIEWHAADKKQFLYIYACKHCHSYFRSTATYATHLLRCAKLIGLTTETKRKRTLDQITTLCCLCKSTGTQASYFNNMDSKCNICGEKLIFKSNSLNSNDYDILLKVEPCVNKPEHVKCLLCNMNLHKEVITNHFNYNVCKYNNPKIIIEIEGNNTSAPGIKKRKSLSSKSSPISEADFSNQFQEPILFGGIYNCKLCYHKISNRKDFHDHIIEHRDVSTAYQCMECGECFVVKPSLIKHLLFYHEISDVEDYFKKNKCFDKDALKELELNMRLVPGESKEPVAENQCRVCRLQFNDPLELNKHFRIHGMAFLLNKTK